METAHSKSCHNSPNEFQGNRTEEISPLDGTEEISPLDGTEEISPLDGTEEISPLDGTEEISPLDGTEEISPLDGTEEISPKDPVDPPPTSHSSTRKCIHRAKNCVAYILQLIFGCLATFRRNLCQRIIVKNNCVAYILWLFFGCLGIHHFYLHRTYHGVIWLSTFGGFMMGWIGDIFRIPEYVAAANEEEPYMDRKIIEMRQSPKPPICSNIFRILWLFIVANIFRSFVYVMLPDGLPNIAYILLIPTGNIIGFYLVMNVGKFACDFKPCVIIAYVGQVAEYISTRNVTHPGTFSVFIPSVLLFIFSRKWNRKPPRKGVCYKTKWFIGTCVVLSAVLIGGTYFHAKVEIDGEEIYLREGIKNFMNSPAWTELKIIIWEFVDDLRNEGWESASNKFLEKADIEGEDHALEVMGLEEGCTIHEIRKRFRELSKEWHPDKHHGQDRVEAQDKFIEIEQAKETLLKIAKRKEGRGRKEKEIFSS